MRNATYRWIILTTIIIIAILVIAQLFLLNKTYQLEQKEFTTNVYKSIQGIYDDVELGNKNDIHFQKIIEKLSDNSFLFKIYCLPEKQDLIKNVETNLETFGVFTDCKLTLYNAQDNKNALDVYLPSIASNILPNSIDSAIATKRDFDYIQLYFPNRNQYVFSQMRLWFFSSIVVILALIALGITIFNLYKQKFQNELQEDFINNVTHEFQTPLTTLTLGLDNIAKPSIQNQPEKLNKYATLMQGQVAYLKQHIDNLMNVLKAESTGLTIAKELIAPNELIKKAIMQQYAIIEEKNAVINLDLEKINKTILADENSLYLVLINLISNAIKYSSNPIVKITTFCDEKHYNISIADNGIGIDEKVKKNIFKKFYRVPTGNIHNVKGLGLGLYFVKQVIDEHKGKIVINSQPNIGTEFILQLPI